MSGPIDIGYGQLAIAAGLLLLNGLLSLGLGLRLEKPLAIAALRTTLQLSLLGYLLVPIFQTQQAGWVLTLAAIMVLVAAHEAARRSQRSFRGVQLATFAALALGIGVTMTTTTFFVLRTDPWWAPRYLIPLVGMILGNALTGISLSLDRCLAELDEGRQRVEAYLAMGADRWEAARPVAAEALRNGLIPLINTMSVVGLVTIPGMMTGQLLGGTPPALAARYQILIMFLIAVATALGSGMAVMASLWRLFDGEHRLRADRLVHRQRRRRP